MSEGLQDLSSNSNEIVGSSVSRQISNSLICQLSAPQTSPNNHIQSSMRCKCGCVPNIPSLFEMAALRQAMKNRSTT